VPFGHIGMHVSDLASAQAYFDELMPLVAFEPGDDENEGGLHALELLARGG
jgi:hypothetical protein